MTICAQCGAENKPSLSVCRMCGQPLEQPSVGGEGLASAAVADQVIACRACGAPNHAVWSFCEKCGGNLHLAEPQSTAEPAGAADDQTMQQTASGHSSPRTLFDPPDDSPHKAVGQRTCPVCSQPIPATDDSCPHCIAADQTIAISSEAGSAQPRLQLIIEGVETDSEYTLQTETVIGRVTGDVVFPGDDYMSGRHARIVNQGNTFFLFDEGSRNGTFVKIRNSIELKPGDTILIGKQVFRFKL